MISSDTRYYLNSIGIELNSRDIQVLKTIIKTGPGLSKPVTFKQIFTQVNSKRKRPFSEAWVYKCLKNLEQAGFLSIQSIGNPKQYMVTEERLLSALAIKCHKRIESLEQEIIELKNNRQLLDDANIAHLAGYLEKLLTKSSISKESIIIEGIDNIKRAIVSEIYNSANPGDTIRVTVYLHIMEKGFIGPYKQSIIRAAVEGVNVLGLVIPTLPHKKGMESLRRFLTKSETVLLKALETNNLQVRLAEEEFLTYRMVCLNSEKMLLYLSHAIDCAAAALFQREDNSVLITDALRTFDDLWESSQEITSNMTSLFK